MILALSGFLFEDDYTSQSISFGEFCELASSAGYEAVELRDTQVRPDMPADQRREIRTIVSSNGLSVSCLIARGLQHMNDSEREDFFQSYLDLCCELNCRQLKILSDTVWLRQAAERAHQVGVELGTNNHIDTPTETIAGTVEYYHAIAHKNMFLHYDPLHLYISGENYVGCTDKCIGLIQNVLVHSARPADASEPDTFGPRNGSHWKFELPDGKGIQDWPAIFCKLKSLGYDGLITSIEHGWPKEKRADIARHVADYLRNLWESAE